MYIDISQVTYVSYLIPEKLQFISDLLVASGFDKSIHEIRSLAKNEIASLPTGKPRLAARIRRARLLGELISMMHDEYFDNHSVEIKNDIKCIGKLVTLVDRLLKETLFINHPIKYVRVSILIFLERSYLSLVCKILDYISANNKANRRVQISKIGSLLLYLLNVSPVYRAKRKRAIKFVHETLKISIDSASDLYFRSLIFKLSKPGLAKKNLPVQWQGIGAYEKGFGVCRARIVASIHLGLYDSAMLELAKYNPRGTSVYAVNADTPEPKKLLKIEKYYRSLGQTFTVIQANYESPLKILSVLKRANTVLIFYSDLPTTFGDTLGVNFFEKRAQFLRSPILLAVVARIPMYLLCTYLKGDDCFSVVHGPLRSDKSSNKQFELDACCTKLAESVAEWTEKYVSLYPEQWEFVREISAFFVEPRGVRLLA